jgi:sugar/nucleoside kinase (ribokinase family)
MNQPLEVICAGIIVADHVCSPIDHLPAAGELVTSDRMILEIGGCAANVAVDLAKMRVRSAVAGWVGTDAFGDVVGEMLQRQGIDTESLLRVAEVPTSQTMIVNVRGQDRRFIHLFGANGEFAAEDIPMDRVAPGQVLYLGGYLVMPKLDARKLADVLAEVRRRECRVVLDVVVPGPGHYLDRLAPLLPHVDVFMPNNDEAELILGTGDPLAQAAKFRAMGARTVVITLGGSGSVLESPEGRWRAGVFPTEMVDGSGSGDAFAAGFIVGMRRGADAVGCLRLASALGASCVRAIGTTPGVFTAEECDAFLAEHSLPIERLS